MVILQQFSFFLNNKSDSDMTISDDRWLHVVIVGMKKFTLINLEGGTDLLRCNLCFLS